MKCNIKEEYLLDYFYKELPDDKRGEYEKHLETCEECRSALEELTVTSKALQTWDVPDQRMNVVFVSEKTSFLDRVKESLPSFDIFRKRPVKSFAYAFAFVFLLISFTNFSVSYDGAERSFSLSAGIFDASRQNPDYELVTQQLVQTQSQIL
ncbi:anti-sigma factor family protein, partial [candidate division KSB1 bacterium]